MKCWKYRSRNRGGLLHCEANGTALAGLTLEYCFLVHCFIAQLRFTDIPDWIQSAETKNGRAKVAPVFLWSVYSQQVLLWKVTSGSFWQLNKVFFMHLVSVALQCDVSLDSLAPLQALVAFFVHRVRRKIPPITQCLSNLAGRRSLLTLHNLYHLLRFFFFGVLLGSQLSVCSRTGCGLCFRCSCLPLCSFPHPLFSVSVQDDSCCCLWSSLGIFCLCFGCSKSTFRSSLALLLDFLLVAILFLSCSSFSAGIPSLFMHAACLFHKSL